MSGDAAKLQLPLLGDSGPHVIHCSVCPPHHPSRYSGVSFGSAVFAQLTVVTIRPGLLPILWRISVFTFSFVFFPLFKFFPVPCCRLSFRAHVKMASRIVQTVHADSPRNIANDRQHFVSAMRPEIRINCCTS